MTTALVTGATGTFGQALLASNPDWTIRAYSRDELKQSELAADHPDVRFLLGDVRDRDRLRRAMEGCDLVIHAAALKRVDAGEYNPTEFVKTNVDGTMNVIEAALDCGVEKAVLLSSDKAVSPANLYGSTKKVAEALFLAANAYGGNRTRFSVVRYGNVKGSRGSLFTIPGHKLTLTDRRATRFWMEPGGAVDLVLLAIREMQGGEVFVPKISAAKVVDVIRDTLARSKKPTTVAEDEAWIAALKETGLRPGEKLHESLIGPEEVGRTYDHGTHYVIADRVVSGMAAVGYERVPPDFTYTSEVSED